MSGHFEGTPKPPPPRSPSKKGPSTTPDSCPDHTWRFENYPLIGYHRHDVTQNGRHRNQCYNGRWFFLACKLLWDALSICIYGRFGFYWAAIMVIRGFIDVWLSESPGGNSYLWPIQNYRMGRDNSLFLLGYIVSSVLEV